MKFSKPTKETIAVAKKLMPRGTTVFGRVTRVSKSGLTRHIRLVVATKRGQIDNVTGFAAQVTQLPNGTDQYDGSLTVKVGGCGFNAIHHVVSHLARVLYGDDRALGYADL